MGCVNYYLQIYLRKNTVDCFHVIVCFRFVFCRLYLFIYLSLVSISHRLGNYLFIVIDSWSLEFLFHPRTSSNTRSSLKTKDWNQKLKNVRFYLFIGCWFIKNTLVRRDVEFTDLGWQNSEIVFGVILFVMSSFWGLIQI